MKIKKLTENNTAIDGREGMPLRIVVEEGQLVISISCKTLAFAFEEGEDNNVYDEKLKDNRKISKVIDVGVFAEDVCNELNREGEDGSTAFTRFLDKIMNEAANQGSLGVDDGE